MRETKENEAAMQKEAKDEELENGRKRNKVKTGRREVKVSLRASSMCYACVDLDGVAFCRSIL